MVIMGKYLQDDDYWIQFEKESRNISLKREKGPRLVANYYCY